MQFIGYYPGANFSSESQFGRQIHVYKFVEAVLAREDVSSVLFVEDDGGEFPSESVRLTDSTGTFPVRVLKELSRLLTLLALIRATNERTVIYTRESPHFAPVVAAELTDAALVVESNGVPRNVEDNVESKLSYYSLTGVRRLKWWRADHLVAVSDSVADYLRANHRVSSVTVVENGVDTDAFGVREPVDPSPPYTICYVGGLQPWQNIELMLETIAAVDAPVELLVVGGEKSRQTELADVASSLGVEDDVTFVGRVPHTDVPAYINQASLCFGPFLQNRPASPLKLYEYLSCGREVFLVNDTGLEQFQDYPGVHRVAFADAETLAPALESVLDDVGTNDAAAERVRAERSWRAVADTVLETCEMALERS